MTALVVTPAELRTAAGSIKTAWQYSWNDMNTLFTRLRECGGSAGTDKPGRQFSSDYDPVAQAAVDAATAFVIGLSQMHDLLQATAANHANANQLSVLGGAADALAFPPGSLEWMQRPEIPNIFGGDSAAPSWWDKIAEYTRGEVWPNATVDTLRDAATGWSWCAEQLNTHLNFQIARDAVSGQQTPEVQQILDQITLLESQAKSLSSQFMTLAHGLSGYAQAVEDTRSTILKELGEFAALFVAVEGVSWVLATGTGGLSVLGGNGALTARAAVVGARIATACRGLVVTAQATGLPVIAATGAFVRSVQELTPLLTSQVSLLTAQSAGLVNPLTLDDLRLLSRTRPYLRVTTTRPVQAAAPKTTINGQEYYVSATDQNVLIPVSGKYDDPAILKLPKDPRGEYYLGAGGIKYPIDSTPIMGHQYGHEFWRMREHALREGMTWKEFCDYVNNPRFYRIEDAPGNSRHLFEAPR
ncbi:HNH/ENDO VII family nuclease [Nocardia xishanensis]|uniref:HNH/ENDO VII family nuclease n=2 Tax=Nocardia TaxID=1817 RepID=A0ABW7X9P0_9NOCA